MDWNPKHWKWPPRILAALRDVKPKIRENLSKVWDRLRKADRKDIRRLWVRVKSYARSYYFTTLVLIAVALAWPWWDMLMTIRGNLSDLLAAGPAVDKDGVPDVRGHYYSVAILIGALAALVTAPLTLLKAYINERQTDAAEQGLITDRFTKAVEQLGAEKTVKRREFKPLYKVDDDENWLRDANGSPIPATRPDGTPLGEWESVEETVPNLEVRLGAIYALERIAQDSERDHIPIMETLCAYIRENSHWRAPAEHGLPEWEPLADDASDEECEAHLARRRERFGKFPWEAQARKWAQALEAPRADIQTALTVIGRRPAEHIAHERRQRRDGQAKESGFQLDLRGANLQRADLTGLDLSRALLTGTRLEGAYLRQARLDGADLRGARLDGADLRGARLDGADLRGADLKSADLRDWTCARTSLRSADFTEAKHLTQDHVNAAWGDSATVLPEGIVMPDHWDDDTVAWHEDDPKYQAWLAAGAPPGKPREPSGE